MRIAIRGHDVVAAGSLNFALIKSARKAVNQAAPAQGGGTNAPAHAASPDVPASQLGLADAERIVNMPKDELVQICTVLGLSTEGHRDDLANRVLAHTDFGAVAAVLGSATADLNDLTVVQLKEFARLNNIDLDGAALKQEIIDVIEASSAPK